MSSLSKTLHLKRWTLDFVADKLAILLVLRQQVVDERESRKKSSSICHQRCMFTALHQRYLKCELLYAEDQRLEVNRQELTPSLLNYQMRGTRLQDGVLWDV